MKSKKYNFLGIERARKILLGLAFGQTMRIRWLDSGVVKSDGPCIVGVRQTKGSLGNIEGDTCNLYMDEYLAGHDIRDYFGIWLGAITKIETVKKWKKRG